MDFRHGTRPAQVRPRPPSTGRPAPARVRPVTPSPTRLTHYRRIERRRGLPLVMKLFLAAAIALLGGAILWMGSGQVGPFVSSVAGGIGGFVSKGTAAAGSPPPSQPPGGGGAPPLVPPPAPLTNQANGQPPNKTPRGGLGQS